MQVSANRNPDLQTFTVTYSSSTSRFDDFRCRQDALFVRAAICEAGQYFPVVEISERGFVNCQQLFICIPRTIEVLRAEIFRNTDVSFIAFESAGNFVGCSPVESICEGEVGNDDEDVSATFANHDRILGHPHRLAIFCDDFSKCESLTSFCIPSHVESIWENTFEDCASLRIVRFEANSRLIQIAYRAFASCSSLESILVPRSVRLLGPECLQNCSSLQNVVFEIDSNLHRIGLGAFSDCSSLRSFLIPSLVDTIEAGIFFCSRICDIEIGEGNLHFRILGTFLLSFDGRFLIRCLSRNATVEIPREVEVICASSFDQQDRLVRVEFESESRLRRIERWAFASCSSLCSICLPSFVNQIDETAFGYSGICSIEIADGNRHFRVSDDFLLNFDGRFLILYFGRDPVVRIPREIEVICKGAFGGRDRLSTVEFESDSKLRRIESCAFSFCGSLRSICLPALLTEIDGTSFWYSRISSIEIGEGNRDFQVLGDFLLSFDGRFLVLYFGRDSVVQIPDGIEVICKDAFSIQDSVSKLEFGNDSQLRRINHKAFSRCRSVHSITIPLLVDWIAGTAFLDCGIEEIRIAEGNLHFEVSGEFLLTTEGRSLIRYFGRSREVKILREIESLSSSSFSVSDIRVVTFEKDSQLRRIESRVFDGCLSVHSICIPPNVDWIDGSAFTDCGIVKIEIAEGNRWFRVFGDFLMNFEGTALIRYFGLHYSVRIRSEVEMVCRGSFSHCKCIRGLQFESPSKVRIVESYAFEKCLCLESILLPASIESICEASFRECRNLEEIRIEIGSKLRRIGNESFIGCSSLTSLFIPRSVAGNEEVELSGVDETKIKWYE
jgi:hypothetical protein